MEQKKDWVKDLIVYQVYPRSFQDSNGDGIGDIPGILSRLDHLSALGINALWLSPVFRSPNDDNGYDISGYREIMDEFGTIHSQPMHSLFCSNSGDRSRRGSSGSVASPGSAVSAGGGSDVMGGFVTGISTSSARASKSSFSFCRDDNSS